VDYRDIRLGMTVRINDSVKYNDGTPATGVVGVVAGMTLVRHKVTKVPDGRITVVSDDTAYEVLADEITPEEN
jgi:hypothetical protein